jgi:septal ring factor EnvC (AmiA/AmiB activator)
MSKTINSLHMAETQKSGKYSLAVSKHSVAMDKPVALPEKKNASRVSKVYTKWVIGLFIATFLTFNLIFIFKLSLIMRSYASERAVSAAKLEKLEQLLSDNGLQIKEISSELQKIALKIQDNNDKFKKIEASNEAMSTAMENLNIAKNTLSDRISALETGLDKINSSKEEVQ